MKKMDEEQAEEMAEIDRMLTEKPLDNYFRNP
jgi:hypothetical protein